MSTPAEMDDWEGHLLHAASVQVAHLYGQNGSRVHYAGAADNGHRWRVLCGSCLERKISAAQYFESAEDKPLLMTNEASVELVARLTQVDNHTFTAYTLLTGQCPDCGDVYFARFPSPKEGR